MQNMKEFEEIVHTGGKIEFLYEEEMDAVSSLITHQRPYASTIVQLCISLEGKILGFMPIGGIGSEIPYPQPSIPVCLLSDREGLFGQACPKCNSYFRSDAIGGNSTCPYCGVQSRGIEFLTKNQLDFLGKYCGSVVLALNEKRTIEIDLDALIDNLDENTPGWVYPEERQQTKKRCACRCTYDILGDYGLCPACGKSNFRDVLQSKFSTFEQQFKTVDEEVSERHDREVEWEKLTRCVSEFEALANTLRKHLINIPATKKRKSDINNLSFQRIQKAQSCLKNWFEIDIFQNIPEREGEFLNKMFNRRHVFTHNCGRIDQEYIDNTGDQTVKVNQVIKFSSREIKRLIPLVRSCATNFIEGYESIS